MKTLPCLAVVSTLIAGFASSALAQDGEYDWRRKDRPRTNEHPGSFAAELRFGPYWPQVDNEFDSAPGPYEKVFDNDPQFYFGLEADWLPLRIPYVGAIGPGIGWGFTSASGRSLATDDAPVEEPVEGEDAPEIEEDATLTIMPMHVSVVARFDELMLRTGIPIVPYAKFGLGFATWSASNPTGASIVGPGCTASDAEKSSDEREAKGCVIGSDTTWGFHMALGGAISLNWIEPRSANNLYESVGIGHLYIFGEWMNAMLNGIGSRQQMRVGSSTFVTGLAADF